MLRIIRRRGGDAPAANYTHPMERRTPVRRPSSVLTSRNINVNYTNKTLTSITRIKAQLSLNDRPTKA